jgi:hypothetical protein
VALGVRAGSGVEAFLCAGGRIWDELPAGFVLIAHDHLLKVIFIGVSSLVGVVLLLLASLISLVAIFRLAELRILGEG